MANIVPIEDEDGEMVDVEVYCSGFCAQSSDHYAGWYGCAEISVSQPCERCEAHVQGLDEE